MKSPKRNPEPNKPAPIALPVSGKFYSVGKVSHLLYDAWEITVVDGVVTAVRCLSRAPDMAATAVGNVTREVSVNLRAQKSLADA